MPARRLVQHLLAAGDTGSGAERARLLDLLDAATRDAIGRGAYDEAAALLSTAVDLARDDEVPADERRWLALQLAEALFRAGAAARARDVAMSVAAEASQVGDGASLSAAALVMLACGEDSWTANGSTAAALEEALEVRGSKADASHARLLAGLARVLAQSADQLPRARALSLEAVALAEQLGDAGLLAACVQSQIDAIWAPGTASDRLALARRMQDAAATASDSVMIMEAQLAAFSALLELGEPGVHAQLDELLQRARVTPSPHLHWILLTRRTMMTITTGDLDHAEQLVAEERELGVRLEEPDTDNVAGGHWFACRLWRVGPVEAWLEGASLPATASMHPVVPVMRDCMRFVSIGDVSAAELVLRTRLEPLVAHTAAWRGLWGDCLVVEVAALLGAQDISAKAYTKLEPLADTVAVSGGAATCHGPVSFYLGLAAKCLGRREAAVGHFRSAHQQAERLGARLWEARAACELAALLPRGSAPEQRAVADLLDSAQRTADVCGSDFIRELVAAGGGPTRTPHSLVRDPDGWTMTFDGVGVHLRDTKGMHDLAQLLRTPHVEIAAADLMAGQAVLAEARLGADRVLDRQATAAYRRRLAELDLEEDRADSAGDMGKSHRVQQERQQLLDALSAATGLAGRPRLLGDGAERARKAVTARLKETLDRIETRHRPLAAHLRESLRTGQHCSYRPTAETIWIVELSH